MSDFMKKCQFVGAVFLLSNTSNKTICITVNTAQKWDKEDKKAV